MNRPRSWKTFASLCKQCGMVDVLSGWSSMCACLRACTTENGTRIFKTKQVHKARYSYVQSAIFNGITSNLAKKEGQRCPIRQVGQSSRERLDKRGGVSSAFWRYNACLRYLKIDYDDLESIVPADCRSSEKSRKLESFQEPSMRQMNILVNIAHLKELRSLCYFALSK
jgi:hypothetical protein